MQKLKNRKVVKSVEIVKPSEQQDGNSDTMTKIINDEIVVAVYGGVLILNEELETVKQFNGIVEWSTCIDGNAEYIAVGYNKGQVCFYNKSCDTSPTVYKHAGQVNSVAVSGALLASASSLGQVHVWDMVAKKELYRVNHEGLVTCVTFHDDWVISSSHDKSTCIWKKRTGDLFHSIQHNSGCSNFDTSPDGKHLAVGCREKKRFSGPMIFRILSILGDAG